jgi:hypothetical protein
MRENTFWCASRTNSKAGNWNSSMSTPEPTTPNSAPTTIPVAPKFDKYLFEAERDYEQFFDKRKRALQPLIDNPFVPIGQ